MKIIRNILSWIRTQVDKLLHREDFYGEKRIKSPEGSVSRSDKGVFLLHVNEVLYEDKDFTCYSVSLLKEDIKTLIHLIRKDLDRRLLDNIGFIENKEILIEIHNSCRQAPVRNGGTMIFLVGTERNFLAFLKNEWLCNYITHGDNHISKYLPRNDYDHRS